MSKEDTLKRSVEIIAVVVERKLTQISCMFCTHWGKDQGQNGLP